jgi:CRISPR/Cas system CSM-associated protein Csm3 (group 7 of RAMP superfamily)
VERIVVTGNLILETPAHLGSGGVGGLTDLPSLIDPPDGSALLMGTSIAGALRNYLREREEGYGAREAPGSLTTLLFGGSRGDPEGEQSPLIVEDARGQLPYVELRDGVKIRADTRTAEEEKRFDMELLAAGTVFPLCFELLVSEGVRDRLLTALALALQGLERGEIRLGARKRRGYGRCRVSQWQVQCYNLTTTDGFLAWLVVDHPGWGPSALQQAGTAIAELLGVSLTNQSDQRNHLTLDATFTLDGSLLIRSGTGEDDRGPDMVHLHSARPDHDNPVPILSGTSLAGVLRQRALRIAKTIATDVQKATELIEAIFGPEMGPGQREPRASRIVAEESVITGARTLVQNRIRLDRFTGGAYEAALFTEAPIFGGPDSQVTVKLMLHSPKEHEIGLLLLVLKDLWTRDLPLGGEAGVGRGRLQGVEAILQRTAEGDITTWTIRRRGEEPGLIIEGDKAQLEGHVQALHRHLG